MKHTSAIQAKVLDFAEVIPDGILCRHPVPDDESKQELGCYPIFITGWSVGLNRGVMYGL